MKDEKKEVKKKTRDQIKEEIKALSEKANKTEFSQLELQLKSEENEDENTGFDTSVFKNIQNPDKAHKIYYSIRRLLIDHLPKGKEFKKLREPIYEEKNLFLNRGVEKNSQGIRGSDGRMTYIETHLEVAFDMVVQWIKGSADPTEIYYLFTKKNEELGYYKNKVVEENENNL